MYVNLKNHNVRTQKGNSYVSKRPTISHSNNTYRYSTKIRTRQAGKCRCRRERRRNPHKETGDLGTMKIGIHREQVKEQPSVVFETAYDLLLKEGKAGLAEATTKPAADRARTATPQGGDILQDV